MLVDELRFNPTALVAAVAIALAGCADTDPAPAEAPPVESHPSATSPAAEQHDGVVVDDGHGMVALSVDEAAPSVVYKISAWGIPAGQTRTVYVADYYHSGNPADH